MRDFYYCLRIYFFAFIFLLSFSFSVRAQLQSTTVFAGGGTPSGGSATAEPLADPLGVAASSYGIFIADSGGQVHRVNAGIMTTIAGGGLGGAVEGGPATSATLSMPCGIVVDRSGNVYVTESQGHRVRKITPAGIITTVAGTGVAGYGGDGGPGDSAQLNMPSGLVLDSAGDLYIADRGNNRVRKLAVNGIISTVAGTGAGGYNGDGIAATTAELSAPYSLALDSTGNLFVGELGNLRVRKINGSGIISTYAGNGTAASYGSIDTGMAVNVPVDDARGLAVDSVGNLYISLGYDAQVCKVDTAGRITLFAWPYGYPATVEVEMQYPGGLTIDSAGDFYIANQTYNIISELMPNGDHPYNVITFAGNGTGSYTGNGGDPTQVSLTAPLSVLADKTGNVYFTDGNALREVPVVYGTLVTIAGTGMAGSAGDGGPADSAALDQPYGIYEDPLGNVYVGTRGDNKIRKISTTLTISTFAGNGTSGYSGDNGPAVQAALAGINGLWGDAVGNIYVSDSIHGVVRRIDTSGIISTIAGTGVPGYSGDGGAAKSAQLGKPNGIGVDNIGNIYIGDDYVNSVRKIDTNGIITTIAGGNATRGYSGDYGPATAALFGDITNIFSDDLGTVYIVDPTTRSIRQCNVHNGILSPFTGPDAYIEIKPLTSIGLGGSGNFYVSDTGTNTIDRLNMFYVLPVTDDTVMQYIRAPYFSGPPTPYYNTAVIDNDTAALAWRRILTLEPSYGSTVFNYSPLPHGMYTFISHVDTAVQTYNGTPLDTRHYEIIPPAGGDSVQDAIEVWISLTDAQNYDNYVTSHGLNLPLMVNPIHQTLNGNNIKILAFHGTGNTPTTSTGNVEEIDPNEVDLDLNDNQYNNGVAYYIITFQTFHGFSNFYFTTATVNILPLTLLSFTGTPQGNDALLKWSTTNEVNTQVFIIQRSSDTVAFTAVGSVNAVSAPGTNNYTYTDKGLSPGVYYYRLQMQDRDGQFTYSPIVAVPIADAGAGSFVLYPNPAKDVLYCQVSAAVAGKYTVQLMDGQGNVLQTEEANLPAGQTTLSFQVANLPSGVYFVSFSDGSNKQTGQFVK